MRLRLTFWACLLSSLLFCSPVLFNNINNEFLKQIIKREKLLQPAGPFCISDPSENLVASTPGGTWSGVGITDPLNGTFDPSIAGAGDHTITYIPVSGTETMIIHVDSEVDATITPVGPLCVTNAPLNLTAVSSGGTWSGTGITESLNGTFNPGFAGSGIHTITYIVTNGACSDTDTEDIQVDANPDSDWTDIGPFCFNDPAVNIVPNTPGGTFFGTGITDGVLGTFDPSASGDGTHSISYSIVNGACNSITAKDVIVYGIVDATITPVGPFCDNENSVVISAVDPDGIWTGSGITNPVTGAFDPEVAGPGTHTITYTIPNGGCSDSDSIDIIVYASPDAEFPEIENVCETDPPFDIIPVTLGGTWAGNGIVDVNNGTFDPSNAGPGTHQISYTISNANCTSVFVRRITVDSLIVASITPAGPFCEDESEQLLTATESGGIWSGTGITDTVTGAFNPSIAGPGIHTITYEIISGACEDTDNQNIQVDFVPNSSINAAGPFCSNDPPLNLTAVTPGGTWSGIGITDPINGTFNPFIANAGNHTITYSLTNGACSSQSTTIIHVDDAVDATISPVSPVCEDDPEFNLIAADNGGTWSGTGITDVINGTFNPTLATAGVHTITYIIVNGVCSDTDTEDIIVNPSPDADFTSIGPFCSNEPSVNIVPNTPGGTWSGTGITDPINGTFNPNNAGGGDHDITYTVILGTCISSSMQTIHVDDDVDATITPVGPFCDNDASINISAVSSGGIWSGTGITDLINGTFDPNLAGVGIHNINYSVSNGLCSDSDNINITVLAAPDATINNPGEFCSDDLSVVLIAATPGGIWAGPGITDPNLGVFDPSTANDGANNITYSVSNAACTSIGNITIFVYDDAVDATILSTGPYCISDDPITLSATSPGGVWSGNGIIDANNGIFDPSIAGLGNSNITYDVGNPACFDTDSQIIQVDDTISAIINPVLPVCETEAAFNLNAINPGGVWSGTGITDVINGTFNPSIAGVGTHTVFYSISQGVCTNMDSIEIQVAEQVDATISPAGPFCENDAAINLVAADSGGSWLGNGIIDPINGTFDPTFATPGIHTITYTITNGPCSDTDTESISVNLFPDSDWIDIGSFCENDTPINITPIVVGGTFSGNGITDTVLGTFNPQIAGVGTHQISYTIINGACTSVTTKPVVVHDDVDATITPAGPFCENESPITLIAADNGGTWSGAGITDPVNGVFSPVIANPGVHTITYTVTNGFCSDTDTESITVDLYPDSDWFNIGPFCENDDSVNIVPVTSGGIFSGTGIINGALGTFDPTTAGAGTHQITYTIINGSCTSITTKPVTVYEDVDATITPAGPFCNNENSILLNSTESGGLWSGTGITNPVLGIFDPALANVGVNSIIYEISNTNCSDSDTISILVYLSPDADFPNYTDICETDPPFNLIPNTLGGIWSGSGVTDTINGVFDPSVAGAGTHQITYTLSNANCTSIAIRRLTVDPPVDATISPAGPFCENDSEQILSAADSGGTWSGNGITDITTGAFNPAIANPGIHTITYGVASGACEDTATINIQVDILPNTTINPAGPFCATDLPINLTSITPGGTWSGVGITDSLNGTFDPLTSGSGDFTITYTIINGACTSQSTSIIHVDAEVDATINSVGPVCEYDPAFNLSAADSGGIWSGTGITDSINGTFDPTIATSGLHTITYTITNGTCSDLDTEIIDVSANPDATIFGAGPFCSDEAAINLTSVTPGGTWSGTGITNPITGEFTPSGAAGDNIITYTITIGACTNSSTTTIHVDADVDATITPAGPFCQYDPAENLSAISTGGTWLGTGITDTINGTFDPTVAGVGIYNINYSVVNGLCSDSDNINITVLIAPDATITDPGEFCSDDPPINLTAATPGGSWAGSGITDAINGTFNPSVANDGANNVTYTVTSGGCTSIGSITIFVYDDAVDATITSNGPYCISDVPVTLSAMSTGGTWSGIGIIDPVNGIFDPSVAGVGNHLITYDVGNPACFDTDSQIIQVDDTISAIINSVAPVCENASAFNFTAANAGGTWNGNGITNAALGTFNPVLAEDGIHTITYTITQGACTNIDTFDMQVDSLVDATISSAGPFCETDPITTLSATDIGGTWSGTGIVNITTGMFHPGLAQSGDHTITYTITNGTCTDTDTEVIHVDSFPNTTISPAGPFCENEVSVTLNAATNGGFWSGNGITDIVLGTFDPAVAEGGNHTISYEITNGACYSVSTIIIDVDDFYDATITPADPFCNTDGSVDLIAASTGGIWSGVGIVDVNNGTFHPGASGFGDFVIKYQTANGLCTDLDSITIHVDEYFDATISPISDFCETDPIVNLVSINPGGIWSGNGIIFPATGTFDPSDAEGGNHIITYEITNGACYSSDTETVHVDDQMDPTITPVGPYCQTDTEITLISADVGGIWSGDGITNSTAGIFNPSIAMPGDHLITYDITNGECFASDTEIIHVDSNPNTILNPIGPFCEIDTLIDLVEPSLGGLWSGNGITNTVTGTFNPFIATDGIHNISYTVINGACSSTGFVNITVDDFVDATITDVGPFCETDGSINLEAVSIGGTWSGTGIINPATGLFNPQNAQGGNHVISYFVENGACNDTDTTTIVVESAPSINIITTGPFCENEGIQVFTANINGGIWSGDGIDMTGNFNPSSAGIGPHTITYTYTSGSCVVIDQVDITVNQYYDAEITSTGPYCYNDTPFNLASINTGGEWSGPGITIDGLFSPAAADVGNHIITYEITNGACYDIDTQSISVNNNPDATIIGPSDVCYNDPIINYTAGDSGGVWSGAGFTDVVAGTFDPQVSGVGGFLIVYEITANGCSSIDFDTLNVHAIPEVTISGLNPHYCLNDDAHIVNVSPTGGILSGGNITGTLFDPQAAGVGTHQISYSYSDINGCSDTAYYNLEVHDMPITSISGIDDYYCLYEDTVYPVLLPLGGTLVGSGVSDNLFVPLSAEPGEFELIYYYTDIYGCSDTSYINTSVIDYANIEFDVTQPLCFGDSTGSITTVVSNASEPFSYLWNDIDNSITSNITNISSGWYSLSVTDSLLCITVDSIYVDEPEELLIDISSHVDVSCFGYDDAWAYANVSGGIPEYEYLWNDNNMTDSAFLDSIPVGTYIITVTDSNLCQSVDTIIIEEPDTLSINFIDLSNVTCYMYTDGEVTVNPIGGTEPYDAVWNDEASTNGNTISNLTAGYYTVTIIDDNGCEAIDSIEITQPDSIYFETTINPVICTQQLGSAGITVYGGTSPYHYEWENGDTVPVLFNLISDIFEITITDANQCVYESFIEIPTDGNIDAQITQTEYNLCYKDEIAELVASSFNGFGDLSYNWSNFVTDSINSYLPAGQYFLTIHDNWGCSGTDSIIVTEPDLLILEMTSEDIKCKGEFTGTASVSMQGGTQPYFALWSNNDTTYYTNGLGAGEISVTITDNNGCIEESSAIITEPPTGIQLSLTVDQVTCFGANDGSINSFASGGNPPYYFVWQINGTEIIGATIRNLGVGAYNLLVTDNNGCTADTTIQIVEANSLIATAETGNTSCIGNYDGYIEIIAGGGTEPYSYYFMDMLWDSNVIDSLYRGEYYITVRDSNNCEYSFGPVIIYDTDEDCLHIPAAFSPNGDGYNDEFFIENLHLYPRAVVQIYNRWGQLLYEDLGINGFWDGTYNGNPVPTGAYLYNIMLNINEDPRVGTVTIIR